jgi:hypothetical protein
MFPGCDAVIKTLPAPTIVNRLLEMVATAELLLLRITGRPDEAVAFNVNGASPKFFGDNGPNEMVWVFVPDGITHFVGREAFSAFNRVGCGHKEMSDGN